MNNNALTVYQLDAMTFVVGDVTARTRSEARAKMRAAVESLTLTSDDPDVTLESLSIDGDIDVTDETPAPEPAEPGAAAPRLHDGLDIFLPHP